MATFTKEASQRVSGRMVGGVATETPALVHLCAASPFPDILSVLHRLAEYRAIGDSLFLQRYASGRKPKAHYFAYEGRLYPVKAVWAAAHNPPIQTRTFRTTEALKGLQRLGFLLVGKSAGALN